MAEFEIIALCPIHPKSIVTATVWAKDHFEALGKVVGEKVRCAVPPGHSFVIHADNVIGWQPLTPAYMPPELVERKPLRRPAYVPPELPEKVYYVEPGKAVERLKFTDWWRH